MSAKFKTRILLGSADPLMRTIIRQLFVSMGAEPAGEASGGEETLALFESIKPDITLLDLHLAGMNGMEALRRIKEKSPDAFVTMMAPLAAMEKAKECVRLGAANYIRKDAPTAELKRSVLETWRSYLEARNKKQPNAVV